MAAGRSLCLRRNTDAGSGSIACGRPEPVARGTCVWSEAWDEEARDHLKLWADDLGWLLDDEGFGV
ncbi:hypothetical protein GCM10010116_33260 [Microbispora rosea subsp. aerata]|nr:hypothetical protein GCM10010116_33260 [Microbispora rosea subsp. aerata]GIH55928.1 hypothetical protein Mro02_28420 [Microbispora rosea subsp. aerata]GLJ83157.1 hypothetical protein GCM10017588_18840 [Microbispora rosea subsp. aerata]